MFAAIRKSFKSGWRVAGLATLPGLLLLLASHGRKRVHVSLSSTSWKRDSPVVSLIDLPPPLQTRLLREISKSKILFLSICSQSSSARLSKTGDFQTLKRHQNHENTLLHILFKCSLNYFWRENTNICKFIKYCAEQMCFLKVFSKDVFENTFGFTSRVDTLKCIQNTDGEIHFHYIH